MSKIDELIRKMCPSGIEYEDLGKVCKIEKGKQLNKEQLSEDGLYPVMNGGINPSGYWNEYNFEENKITISQGGASAGYINFLKTKFWAGAHCYVVKICNEFMNYKFIYHFLKEKQKHLLSSQVGAGIPSISLKEINALRIPMPPLEVQEEIVRILDKFGVLEAELEAELEARKSQYEFWRGKLLNSGFERIKLKDITYYSKDRISFDELNEDNYVGVDNLLQNKMGKMKSTHVPVSGNSTRFEKDDILIGNIRPYLRKIWIADCYGGTNGDVLDIRVKNLGKINPRFLYYVLSSEDFFEYNNSNAKGAKMPRGDKQAIMNYELNVPSLEEQEKIANILDKFDKLVNDISIGLPAEIEARRKQYEYYRNKLLSFEEIVDDE